MIPITRHSQLGIDSHHKTRWIINHGAGVLDISITGAMNLLWTFPDASTSTLTRPEKTVTAGRTIITCNDFSASSVDVFIYETATALTDTPILLMSLPGLRGGLQTGQIDCLKGNILQIPRLQRTIGMYACTQIRGDIKNLPRKVSRLLLYANALITGDIVNIPMAANYINIGYCSGISGSVETVTNTGELYVYGMDLITGALTITATNSKIWFFGNTLVSPAEYDQTVANVVAAGRFNGLLYISSRRTSASDANIATLISRGWTINEDNA